MCMSCGWVGEGFRGLSCGSPQGAWWLGQWGREHWVLSSGPCCSFPPVSWGLLVSGVWVPFLD